MATNIGPASGLAERYAGALYELADESKVLDQVADDMRSLKSMLAESADFRRLVQSPVIRRDDQERAIAAVTEKAGAQRLTANFLRLVARNRRLFAVGPMADAFLSILAKRRGEVQAKVTTARPLTDEQISQLDAALREVAGAKVSLEVSTDQSLLGGLVVQLGSRMYDSSLRTKLQRLQSAMKGVQ